jgi:RNA polymerase sigma-70 factor, ECF subfamily
VAGDVERLVRRARGARVPLAEQHAAFARLVALHERMALATALASLHDAEAARDAAQEAFLDAWRKLPQLRTPAAFPGWLQRLVRTQCARIRRRREPLPEPPPEAGDAVVRAERRRAVARALEQLAPADREALLLFHVLGEPQRRIAEIFGVSAQTIGKRLYGARLRLRRLMPRSVAREFLVTVPTSDFVRRVRAGLFDEVVGTYRFESQPKRVVIIRRAGDLLISESAGQRNVLAANGDDALVTTAYDGEGRFRRDRSGRITHFVYYEFGRRLGVARKVD